MAGEVGQHQQQQRAPIGPAPIMLTQRDFSRAHTKLTAQCDQSNPRRKSQRASPAKQEPGSSRASNWAFYQHGRATRATAARAPERVGHHFEAPPELLAAAQDGDTNERQVIDASAALRQTLNCDQSSGAAQAGAHLESAANKQQQVGPVMGIFFKVWSLVKVTKMRHQNRLVRRQASEDAANFRYISGDQLTGAASASSEQRDHFRRAGSQPAPSLAARLQVTPPPPPPLGALATATTTSSSSGVSSASGCPSSQAAANAFSLGDAQPEVARSGPRAPGRNSAEPQPLARASDNQQRRAKSEAKQLGEQFVERQRRKLATSRRASSQDEPNELARRSTFAAVASAHQASFERCLLGEARRKQPPSNPNGDQQEDSDANEIYSTPNDSVQSVSVAAATVVRSGARSPVSCNAPADAINVHQQQQQQQQHVSQAHRMIKSFSTNNFAQLVRQATSGAQTKEAPQRPEQRTRANKRGVQDERQKHTGSHFFISSSSSEESNPPQLQLAASCEQRSSALQQAQAQLALQRGVHQHRGALARAAMQRPDSLVLPTAPHFGANSLASASPQLCPEKDKDNSIATMSPLVTGGGDLVASCRLVGAHEQRRNKLESIREFAHYKKSPSLYEMSASNCQARFSSKFPAAQVWANSANRHQLLYGDQQARAPETRFGPTRRLNTFLAPQANQEAAAAAATVATTRTRQVKSSVPNSISLFDCKLASATVEQPERQAKSPARDFLHALNSESEQMHQVSPSDSTSDCGSEYKLAQMLLRFGSDSSARDEQGNTALMHSVMSDNLAALKCLIEQPNLEVDQLNWAEQSALDLICLKRPNELRLEMFKLLIDANANLDKGRPSDGSRLLDRLIAEHRPPELDKIPYIDCLLHNGAKLASSTWAVAQGKFEIQLRLLRKLCQDGYFLYKKSSIEAAVYRFEYSLKRIAELEQQLSAVAASSHQHPHTLMGRHHLNDLTHDQLFSWARATQQVKYQTYLGLSRCERKRKFFKRALEFAHMTILVDSTSYEGYYSKAHILKDTKQFEDALLAIEQTARLVDRSIDIIKDDLNELQIQDESIVFDGCFNMHDPGRSNWIEVQRVELNNNLEYLEEAQRHIFRLRSEILEDKQMSKSSDS